MSESVRLQEELEQRLIASMDVVEKSVKAGAGFVAEQTPELVKEILLVGRIEHTLLIVLAFLVLMLSLKVAWWFIKKQASDADIPWLMGLLLLVAPTIISCSTIAGHFKLALMSWFAPRLYLLEQIKDFVK